MIPASESAPAAAKRADGRSGLLIKVGVSLLIVAASVWLMRRGALPLAPSREALSRVNWGLVGFATLVWAGATFLRAARWHWLLLSVARVPLRAILRISFVGFAALIVLPLRAGEFVRPLMIRKECRISGWAATATVGAERLIDGFALSTLLVGSLLWAEPVTPLPTRIGNLPVPVALIPKAAYAAAAVFASGCVAMLLFYARSNLARRLTEFVLGPFSKDLAKRVAQKIEEVASGLSFLRNPRLTVPFVIATLAYWLGAAWNLKLLGDAAGLADYTMAEAVATLGVLGLGILLPNAPGFFGAFQLSIYAALALYFHEVAVVGAGSVLVFLAYVTHIALTTLAGAAALLIGPGKPPATADAAPTSWPASPSSPSP